MPTEKRLASLSRARKENSGFYQKASNDSNPTCSWWAGANRETFNERRASEQLRMSRSRYGKLDMILSRPGGSYSTTELLNDRQKHSPAAVTHE
jgi:hypothetical protein